MYVGLAFLIGVSIVMNMMLNGRLSKKEGMVNGVLINYLMAAVSSMVLSAIMLQSLPSYSALTSIPLPYLLGGLIGVLTTYVFNLIVLKVPAVYIVILRFIGQMLTSAVIDYLYLDIFSAGKLLGGVLFLLGLMYNSNVDYNQRREKLSPPTVQRFS